MSEELKNCPFCGAKAGQGEWRPHWDALEHAVFCMDECGAQISKATKAEAITAWNTRVGAHQDDA